MRRSSGDCILVCLIIFINSRPWVPNTHRVSSIRPHTHGTQTHQPFNDSTPVSTCSRSGAAPCHLQSQKRRHTLNPSASAHTKNTNSAARIPQTRLMSSRPAAAASAPFVYHIPVGHPQQHPCQKPACRRMARHSPLHACRHASLSPLGRTTPHSASTL